MGATDDRDGRETYTHGHHESVLRSHRARTAQNSAAYLVPRLRPGMRLLDVGCGPGTITQDLARLVAPGDVLGIDAEPEIVATASEAAHAAGIANLRFEIGNVYSLAHHDGSFDVVHAHQVLQHVADPVAALREMRRVTTPGGVVAARDADYAAMTWHPASDALEQWAHLYQQVARANGGEPDAGRRLLGWAHAAGFDAVEASASAWCFATPGDRSWWGDLWADRTVGSAFGAHAVALGLARPADLEVIAAGWREWARAPDGWFAVLHGEVVATA